MQTRETRKRERERDVKERAEARNENAQCALIDASPASHDGMYFCLSCVCLCRVSTCDVSLPKRVPFNRVNLPAKGLLCNTKSQCI